MLSDERNRHESRLYLSIDVSPVARFLRFWSDGVSLVTNTENKRLGAVLEHSKAEQDKAPPKKRHAGKQSSRYKPNGRRNDGWNSLADRKCIADRKASQGCDI